MSVKDHGPWRVTHEMLHYNEPAIHPTVLPSVELLESRDL
jgi:hypothetical protein